MVGLFPILKSDAPVIVAIAKVVTDSSELSVVSPLSFLVTLNFTLYVVLGESPVILNVFPVPV